MAGVQISEVDSKFAIVSVELLRVTFDIYGNLTILVWQLKQYLCNSAFHSWTDCLTTLTMVVNVNMETK
jgi:hypothetical protein